MTSSIQAITMDCDDALILSSFWAGVLGESVDPDEHGSGPFFQSIGRSAPTGSGVAMMFIKVPEGKTAKNRMHLDLSTADREVETERLLTLGASLVDNKDEWGVQWTTLSDPEGNEFCVAEAHKLFE